MTESEAKYYLLEHKPIIGFKTYNEALDVAIEALEKIIYLEQSRTYEIYREYLSIGTVEEFKALKEKNEPKSPLRIPTDDSCLYYELRCPSCNAYMSGLIEMHHCKCGQRLSWE